MAFALDVGQISNYIANELGRLRQEIETMFNTAVGTMKNEVYASIDVIRKSIESLNDSAYKMGARTVNCENELGNVKSVLMDLQTRVTSMEGTSKKSKDCDNLLGKREMKDLAVFGGKAGVNFVDWHFDVIVTLEQVCPVAKEIVKWVESLETYEEISDNAMHNWIVDTSQPASDAWWAVDQLFYVLTRKTEGVARDLVQSELLSETGAQKVRGARAWKRVQTYAWGMTQNRRLEILNRVAKPERAKTYDELAQVFASWEKDVRELAKFSNSSLSDDQKIQYLKQLVPTQCEEWLTNMSCEGPKTYEKVKQYVENQIAERRTGKSFGVGTAKHSTRPASRDAMDCNHVGQSAGMPPQSFSTTCGLSKDEENYEDEQNEQGDVGGLHAFGGKGKGSWSIQGYCDNCNQWGHPWRACPKLDEQGKAALAQKKGHGYKGIQKGSQWGNPKGQQLGKGGFGKGGNFPVYGKAGKGSAGKGWSGWNGNSYNSKGWGKKGGLNEFVFQYGSEEDNWLDFGIHSVMMDTIDTKAKSKECGWTVAESRKNLSHRENKVVPVQLPKQTHTCMPVMTSNSYAILPVNNEDLEGVIDASEFPELDKTSRSTRPTQSARPKGAKFRNNTRMGYQKFMQGIHKLDSIDEEDLEAVLEDIMQQGSDVDQLGLDVSNVPAEKVKKEIAMDRLEPEVSSVPVETPRLAEVARPFIHFLGPLEPNEVSLNQVQADEGYHWTAVTSIMDSGAIHSVASPSVGKGTPVQESHGSINGLQYHTADGTRIPNLGQKTLEVVTEGGQRMNQTFQMAEVTRPLSSVGEIADKGNAIVFGRRGGFIHNLATGHRLSFSREQGVYLLKTWLQEPNDKQADVFPRQG